MKLVGFSSGNDIRYKIKYFKFFRCCHLELECFMVSRYFLNVKYKLPYKATRFMKPKTYEFIKDLLETRTEDNYLIVMEIFKNSEYGV